MKAKKLGFGLMRLPLLNEEDKGSIDIEHVKRMVDTFIERGFTYFDTAWMYCKFQSENATKAALVDRYPRESYTLATKLHANFFETKEKINYFSTSFLLTKTYKMVIIRLQNDDKWRYLYEKIYEHPAQTVGAGSRTGHGRLPVRRLQQEGC